MANICFKYIENRLKIPKSLISAYVKCYILSGFLFRAIIRKTSELEYGIHRRSLSKDSFIRYVQVSNFTTSESPHKFKISYRTASLMSVSFELLELMVSRKAVFEQE